MRHALLLCCWLTIACASALAWELPVLTVGKATAAPTVDSALSEYLWQSAAGTPLFCDFRSGRVAAAQTAALLAWDDRNLYVAFDCAEPRMADLRATVAERDGALWGDDCVELFLRPAQGDAYYHFIVNPLGAVYDSLGQDANWSCEVSVAAARGEASWTCELAIPWEALGGAPQAGSDWSGNLCRCRRTTGQEELTSWSVTGGSFHNLSAFGSLRFRDEAPSVRVSAVGALLPGLNRLQARLTPGARLSLATADRELGASRVPATNLAYVLQPDDLREPLRLSVLSADGDVAATQAFASPAPAAPSTERLAATLERLRQLQAAGGPLAERLGALVEEGAALTAQVSVAVVAAIDGQTTVRPDDWARTAQRLTDFIGQASGPLAWSQVAGASSGGGPTAAGQTTVDIAMACNERESAALMLSGLLFTQGRDLRFSIPEPSVAPGPPSDGRSWREHILLREAVAVPLRSGGMIADPLPELSPSGTVHLDAEATREVWVTVDSEGLAPGYYVCDLIVSPVDPRDGAPALTVPLRVRVWPVELPAQMPMSTFTCDYNRSWRSPAHLADLLSHHTNVFNCNALPEGGTDFSAVASRVAPVKGKGLLFVEVWFMRETGWKPEYEQWVRGAAQAMEAAGLGFDEWVLHIYDETLCPEFLECARQIKAIEPRIRIFTDCMGTPEQIEAFAPYVDYWCPHFADLRKADGRCLELMRATGKPIWTYECGSQKTMPIGHCRALPWVSWRDGLQGSFNWCYPGSAWDERGIADINYGHIYEGYRGGPVSSKRWEAWSDGLEDYLLLTAYSARLGDAPDDLDRDLLAQARKVADLCDGDPAEISALRSRIAHRLLELSETPIANDFPGGSFPGWSVRSSGDGRGSGQMESGGRTSTQDLAMVLRAPTDRSWVFVVKPLQAREGQRVKLTVWAKGTGRLRTGVCDGFNFGGDPGAHRVNDRWDGLTGEWRQYTVEHEVAAQPVEAFIGFDYGQDKGEVVLADVEVTIGP